MGISIVNKQLNTHICNDLSIVSFSSKEDEYRAAASWAKQYQDKEQGLRIGIIVPSLVEEREHIASIFAEYFPKQIYNIAAPRAIANYPLIDLALMLLNLSTYINNEITINDLNKLLRTPFIIAAESEMLQRATLAIMLQDHKEIKFTYQSLQKYLSSLNQDSLGKSKSFENSFNKWMQLLEQLQGKHTAEYWLTKFQDILQAWGWPGERAIDYNEKQLLSCWKLLLNSYLQTGFILKKHSFTKACKVLQQLAFITPFLPETGDVSIHILGLLEGAGLPFDRLWVIGMHSGAWPMPAKPNPFIPVNIQRQYNLPRSSPTRELMVAKDLTYNLSRGGMSQVVYSYAKIIDDITTTASRLVANFKKVMINDLVENDSSISSTKEHSLNINKVKEQCLEELSDNEGAELSCYSKVYGGSRVLKLQAQCPFWAPFAEFRLGAVPMTMPSIGLTPAERGELLHNVLAEFWQYAKTHKKLMQISEEQLNSLVISFLEQNLQKLYKKRPYTLTKNYLSLEIARMNSLINKWLLYEKQREPFIVYKIEQQQLLRIGQLDLKIRIDRIDQLETGEIVIIDYKTGKTQVKEWFSDPILDPQLPLYCLATEVLPDSIAFAVIRPESTLFKGIAKSNGLLPNVSTLQELVKNNQQNNNWQQQLLKWEQQLSCLADDFKKGEAMVQPTLGTATCRLCRLQSLCRIYEKSKT